ncbi:MAG: DEAD/DEAH box helicase [Candidatus Heimdallarchaeota archaeon]|nr:DEAD/DEAH box helicase [Candidatus Heimdallarchaeota archaeon]MCK4878864.1 DEAD/DEAH box helicase [Candidatus Heimdallarchaeota archaeon]
MKFQDYDINNQIKRALDEMGIHNPTEIQRRAIPQLLDGGKTHVLAQAKTGTGKTLAFAIPIVNQISPKQRSVQAVVLVPTRELCKQVHSVLYKLTKYRKLKTVEVYGGVSIDRQKREIKAGAQIVIATPGRLMDLYRRRAISFNNVRFVVLDEADRMLDMGFLPDIQFILFDAMKKVSPRLLLFSATMLKQIIKIVRQFTKGERVVEINVSKDDLTVENCKQFYYKIRESKQKYSSFVNILRNEQPKSSIIFVNTKRWGDKLRKRLSQEKRLNLRFDTLHGDKTQRQREFVLKDFRNEKFDCLIATNVAARGLDIPHVTHIFNFDLPREGPEIYVHRIGRTSRMEGPGKAISLVADDQMKMLREIEKLIKKPIQRLYFEPKPKNPKHSKSNQSTSFNQNRKKNQVALHASD